MLERLADVVYRRRRLVLAGSLVFVVFAFAIGGRVFSLLTSSARDFEDPASQSVEARRQLERATGANPEISLIALIRPGAEIATPAGAAEVRRVAKVIAADKAVARVLTAFNTGNRAFVSRDGRSSYVVATFAPLSGEHETDAAKRIERALKHDPAVTLGGPVIATSEADDQIGRDLARAERFGIPILILLSLLFFRGLVAALLPIATGIFAVAGTFLVLRLVDAFAPLSVFAINMVTGLGIGLGIDYSLFILSRYREEMAQSGGPGREALVRTLGTAGRTVVFSSLTVAAAIAALFAFPQRFLYSMALGGAFVALFSAVSALVFLSAIVAVLGRRVDAISPRWLRRSAEREASAEQSGFWYRLSQAVMRYPLPVVTVTLAVLILLGIPFLNVRFTGADAGILPTTASARQVQDAIAADFRENETSPIYIAAVPPAASAISRYAERLRSLPNVLRVDTPVPPPPGRGASTWRVDVFSDQLPLADATKRLVKTIRERGAAFPIAVGGESAAFVDQESSIRGHLPLGLGIAATTTIILLFLMTGSLVLPLKTILLNIVSLSATLGFLVLIFQYGHLEGLLDFTSQGALNMTQPILIGAIAFALSTDYAVFLLTRIKEARDAGHGETESVAVGIERTGRIVTAAALLLAVAIGAFATSRIILIKELGLGVAFAVLLDATIVRALLVPALMKILGKWNWWAPAPLRRFHERFGFAEASVTRQPAAP